MKTAHQPPAGTRLSSYALKGSYAVIDQGLFAATNFIVNVLMARWLEPEVYGAFSIAFTVFLLISAFYTAVLTEPMMVFGAGKYKTDFSKYLGLLSYIHLGLSGIVALILAVIAIVFHYLDSPHLAGALLGLTIASPMLLFTGLMRSACYVRSRPQWAAAGGAIYLFLSVVALYLLLRASYLTPGRVFVSMGVAALLTSIWFVGVLAPNRRFVERRVFNSVLGDHWTFGSWNAAATALNLASGQILLIMVPPFFGFGAAAQIAASLNFMRPLNPLIRSVTSVALPYASRLRNSPATNLKTRISFERLLLLLPVLVLIYGVCISLLSSHIFFHVYGSHRYDNCGHLVFLLSLTYTASTLVQVLSVSIKATGNTRSIVGIWALPGLVTCLLSIPVLLYGSLSSVLSVFAISYWLGAAWCWRIAKGVDSTSDFQMLPALPKIVQ